MSGEFEHTFEKILRAGIQRRRQLEDRAEIECGRRAEHDASAASTWNIRQIGPFRGHAGHTRAGGRRPYVRRRGAFRR